MKKTLLFLCLLCATLSGKAAQSDVVTSNPFKTSLTFTDSGSYGWTYDSTNKRLQSTNKGVQSSTSSTTITFSTNSSYGSATISSTILSFNYSVSSESNYDKLTVTLDGKTIVSAISGENSGKYKGNISSGSHTLVLTYTKDSSQDSGDDRAYISDIQLNPTGSCGDNLVWTLNGDGLLTISGSGKMTEYTREDHGGDEDWCWVCTSPFSGSIYNDRYGFGNEIKSVVISNGVTSIGSSAFSGCSGLTSVSIPSSVTSIGSSAFSGCSGLKNAEFESIESLCKISFGSNGSNPLSYAHHLYIKGKEVTDLVVPSSVTSIGSYAFYGCSGLTSVTIPSSVTSIGSSAFSNCSGWTSVSIPSSVMSIGSDAFSGCSNVKELKYEDGCTKALRTYLTSITSVSIPKSVKEISSYAFYSCSSLTSVSIPSSVTSIESYAFAYCI